LTLDKTKEEKKKVFFIMFGVYIIMTFFGIPIDGRTIATGKFPASFNNIASARAFVNANKKKTNVLSINAKKVRS
jgi:hypothetical protein